MGTSTWKVLFMSGKLQVVPLKTEHLDQVLDIERASFPTPWSRQSFLGELLHNNVAYYFGCISDEKMIGYAGMWIIIDEAHITNVAVHPNHRGQKIGHILMLHLMAQALERGVHKMTLEVRPSNIYAQKLYTCLGFEGVGRRKGYYSDNNEDAIIMWKDLILEN